MKALKSRTWLSALLVKSELPSPYALESFFSHSCLKSAPVGERKRTSRWHRYQRGETSPSRKTVALAELHFPGTALWIHTPLWKLIEAEIIELDDIAAVIGTARPHLARHVKARHAVFAKPMTVDSLWRQSDIKALSALLAIARHAEITEDLAQYVEASWAAFHLAIFLSATTALSAVREEFLDALWDRFFSRLRLLSFLPNEWSWGHSLNALRNVLDEANRRQSRLISPQDSARLAFWVAKNHPFYLTPTSVSPESLLDQYEIKSSTGERYFARSMNFVQQIHFNIMREPLSIQNELIELMAEAENRFVKVCQNQARPYSDLENLTG